jgi:hypothetical protein
VPRRTRARRPHLLRSTKGEIGDSPGGAAVAKRPRGERKCLTGEDRATNKEGARSWEIRDDGVRSVGRRGQGAFM